MRCFSLLILSVALIIAAVNCEETEKVEAEAEAEEDIPKEVCELNFFGLYQIIKLYLVFTASFWNFGCDFESI